MRGYRRWRVEDGVSLVSVHPFPDPALLICPLPPDVARGKKRVASGRNGYEEQVCE